MLEVFVTVVFYVAIAIAYLWTAGAFVFEFDAPFIGAFVMGPLVAAFVGLITFGIIAVTTNNTYTQHPVDLKSLNTSMATHGQYSSAFFVGTGYIKSEPVYSFYAEIAPNHYKMVTVNSQKSSIVETKGKPHAVCKVDLFYTPAPFGDSTESFLSDPEYAESCTLYVPAGSVSNNIDPNLGN